MIDCLLNTWAGKIQFSLSFQSFRNCQFDSGAIFSRINHAQIQLIICSSTEERLNVWMIILSLPGNYIFAAEKECSTDGFEVLFTNNETNMSKLTADETVKVSLDSFTKDAFHEYLINGENSLIEFFKVCNLQVVIIINLMFVFFQDYSRIWTATSQHHKVDNQPLVI